MSRGKNYTEHKPKEPQQAMLDDAKKLRSHIDAYINGPTDLWWREIERVAMDYQDAFIHAAFKYGQ